MNENRDDFEPIIAERRSRAPLREESQPLWPLVLGLSGGLVLVVLLAWWFLVKSSGGDAPTTAGSEGAARETFPEERIEETPLPLARDVEPKAEVAPPPAVPVQPTEPTVSDEEATVQDVSESVAEETNAVPALPTSASVRLMSPDSEVRIEFRDVAGSSSPVTASVGDSIELAPGTYRIIASGSQLETFEQEVTFEARSYEYTVELCAQREQQRESLTGQVVEERTCSSTTECESVFMVLSEYADQLVKDREFRTARCERWRPSAAPTGQWTLNTTCDGATPTTTCSIAISEGGCAVAEPSRSARGETCPRAELM